MNVENQLCEVNDLNFNILKALEEMSELSEVLLKYLTKIEELKPPVDKIIEEMGDVFVRLGVIEHQLDIGKETSNRVYEKRKMLEEAITKRSMGSTCVITKTLK